MSGYKVGDRVMFKIFCSQGCPSGSHGTVRLVESSETVRLVMDSGYRTAVISCKKFLEAAKPTYPNPPHKHAELIKAWADGAAIQISCNYGDELWKDVKPDWSAKTYRIKPTKSTKDIQIEKLEEQAQQLAKDIAKLKES